MSVWRVGLSEIKKRVEWKLCQTTMAMTGSAWLSRLMQWEGSGSWQWWVFHWWHLAVQVEDLIKPSLSGHDIFDFLFQPILCSLNGHSPFLLPTFSLWLLRFHDLRTRTGLLWKVLTIGRTKHGSIRWSPPQWHPLLSPPQHPLHPEPADHDRATHRGDPPVHRR